VETNYQVPTPSEYVSLMLNYAGYQDHLYGKRILENSCGEGNILVEIVKRYIQSAIKERIDSDEIIRGLECDVIAFETDLDCIIKCKKRLNNISEQYGLRNIMWNIKQQDYLMYKHTEYDFIIGNPPYITYHNLNEKQRNYLRRHFESCKKGRFDYCYAFIEKCLKEMNENAKLVYLVPYSVVRNKFSLMLRNMILPQLEELYDYKGIQIFPNRVTSSVILVCGNIKNKKDVLYHNMYKGTKHYLPKTLFGDSWIFDKGKKGSFRFGDYFKVSNSVATLCNDVFLFEKYGIRDDLYILKDGKVEETLVYDAISTKSKKRMKKTGKLPKIIFPYKVVNQKVKHINEVEFKKNFPNAYQYLLKKREQLGKRKVSETVHWYEYGRSQAISDIFSSPKLIMPMILTHDVHVYMANKNAIPYAGYYVKALNDMTLAVAKKILESKEFYEYVTHCGTPTTPTSYRVSVKDICNYYFDL